MEQILIRFMRIVPGWIITKIWQTKDFSEIQDMVQSGNGSVAEATTTILNIKGQLKVQLSTLLSDACFPDTDYYEQFIKYQFYY